MKNSIKKIAAGTLLFVITFISGVITLVLYPQPLFANKLEYKNFKVYSNNKIDNDIKIILNNANTRVAKSELNDPSYTYDIFLSYNSLYNTIDDQLLGKGPSARAIDNNLVIKIRIDPARNLSYPTFRGNCEVNLTHLITHEMIHCLQAHKYGKMKFNPFHHPEMWKLEGYPEYVSKQMNRNDDNDLVNEINRYTDMESKSKDGWILAGDNNCSIPEIYYRSALMTKYLIDVKHFSYGKILRDTVEENTVYNEMIKWKNNFKQIHN